MGLQVEEIIKGDRIPKDQVGNYGRKEVERVQKALDDAKQQMYALKVGILTKERTHKIAELEHAIAVGEMYLKRLKEKWLR